MYLLANININTTLFHSEIRKEIEIKFYAYVSIDRDFHSIIFLGFFSERYDMFYARENFSVFYVLGIVVVNNQVSKIN